MESTDRTYVFECGCVSLNIKKNAFSQKGGYRLTTSAKADTRICPIHKKKVDHFLVNCTDCGTEIKLNKKSKAFRCKECNLKANKKSIKIYKEQYNQVGIHEENRNKLPTFEEIAVEMDMSMTGVAYLFNIALDRMQENYKKLYPETWRWISSDWQKFGQIFY